MYSAHRGVVWDSIPTCSGQGGWILGIISSLKEWCCTGTAAWGVGGHPWGCGIRDMGTGYGGVGWHWIGDLRGAFPTLMTMIL